MHRMMALFALSTLVLVTLPVPTAEADLGAIQPGDIAWSSVGQCTLNFVFDGPGGATYVGIAAHCVEGVGSRVATSMYGYFGEVAWMGNPDNEDWDFAFIEVYPEFEAVIDPSVRAHPQYPTGFTTEKDTTIGDLIQISGHGMGFSATTPTETQRVGFHARDDSSSYGMYAPIIFGDSGGPLVHIKSGKAYGIVSMICVGIGCSLDIGPSVEGIITKAADSNFPVSLRTV